MQAYIQKNVQLLCCLSNVISLLKFVCSSELNIGLQSSGGATVAANASVDEKCLKRHRRWKSGSAKDGYIFDSIEKRLQISEALDL